MTTEKATPPGIALDNEALDKLEALARAATPGPWSYETEDNMINYDGDKLIAWQPRSNSVGIPQRCANGAFIAAANPATMLKLVAQARAAQPQTSAAPACFLNSEEMAAFRRFDECAQDGEGYDVPKQMMQRLAEIGVVQRRSGAYYQTTEFGTAMLAAAPSPNFAARGAEPADNLPEYVMGLQPVCFAPGIYYAKNDVDQLRAQLSAARQGQGEPSPFRLGNEYQTQGGEWVRFVKVHNEGTHYETMEDQHGHHRYTSRDFGRCTGTAHDYSYPGNTPPLYAAPHPTAAPTPQARPAGAPIEMPYYGYTMPLHRKTDTKSDVVRICDAAGDCIFDLNTHTSRSLDDAAGLAEELKGADDFADFIVQAVNRGAAAPTPHEQEARAAVPIIDKNAKGYRPPFCDGGGLSSRCCNDGCSANRELAEMAQAGMLPVAQTDAARDVLCLVQELNRISMTLAADLVQGEVYTFQGHDYLDRNAVCERVIQWRAEWDTTAPAQDALAKRARVAAKGAAGLEGGAGGRNAS